MGMVNAQEQAVLDYFLRATTWTLPTDWYIGLSTTTPTETGSNFTEPGSGAYARVQKTRNGTNWTAATGGDPSYADNATAITFPTATASWGTITYVGLFAASTGGTPYFTAALSQSKTINTDDTAEIAIGALDLKVGDPGDTY